MVGFHRRFFIERWEVLTTWVWADLEIVFSPESTDWVYISLLGLTRGPKCSDKRQTSGTETQTSRVWPPWRSHWSRKQCRLQLKSHSRINTVADGQLPPNQRLDWRPRANPRHPFLLAKSQTKTALYKWVPVRDGRGGWKSRSYLP